MATLQMNFLSMSLGMQTNVSVFLPSFTPSPEAAGKSHAALYPRGETFRTLWLLGTEAGDDGEWLRESAVLRLAEQYRLAVVFPCGYEKLYSEEARGQKFRSYLTNELYAVCTGTFPLSRAREDHIIGGASLGAYGALKCALAAPEKFGSVILMGGAYEKGIAEGYLPALRAEMARCGLVPHCALDDTAPDDAELLPKPGAPKPAVWLGWAADSPLAPFAYRAAANLAADGFALSAQKEYPGADDWDFRDAALRDALRDFGKEA